MRTLRAPPPAWLESGTPPDNSSRHIIAAGTFAAADPAHIIVAGSERRAPRPPLAHPPTLAHTACRTALAPARSRSHDLYTTHGTHLDKRPSALHVPSVAIVKLAAVAIVKLSRRRCRKPPLSQAAAVRCRDGQASAVALVKPRCAPSALAARTQLAPHHRGRNLRGRRRTGRNLRAGRPRAAGSTPAARTAARGLRPPATPPGAKSGGGLHTPAARTPIAHRCCRRRNTDSHSLLQPSNARLRWVVRPAGMPARRPPPTATAAASAYTRGTDNPPEPSPPTHIRNLVALVVGELEMGHTSVTLVGTLHS